MSRLNDLIANYSKESNDLWDKFTLDRKLPFDIDTWPENDQNDWYDISDSLRDKLDAAIEELEKTPLDEQESEDFYMIDVTIDTNDGPIHEVIDIRKVSLDRLKDICSMFPVYNDYYFKKVVNSL